MRERLGWSSAERIGPIRPNREGETHRSEATVRSAWHWVSESQAECTAPTPSGCQQQQQRR